MLQTSKCTRCGWLGVFIGLLLALGIFALGYWTGARPGHPPKQEEATSQSVANAEPDSSSVPAPVIPANATPELKEFLQARAVLAQKMEDLRKQNPNVSPTAQQLAQFQLDNAALVKRQNELAQIMATQQSSAPMPIPPPLRMPPNASPQLKAFLTARDQLMRDDIAFTNQHLKDDPAAKEAALRQWQTQMAAQHQKLNQLAQALSETNSK
jgi:hypothetical protein